MINQHPPADAFAAVGFGDGAVPEAHYSAGLATYHERLFHGRFVAHHHSTTGRVKYTQESDALLDAMVGRRPVEAFALTVDGHDLASHWRWAGAGEQPLPAGHGEGRHAVVHLVHDLRPVEVRVHTLLDGSPFLVRWLEITNTGDRPAALAAVAPWSGLLWHVPAYQSRLPAEATGVFSLGHYSQTGFGHEGDFVWETLRAGTTRRRGTMGRSGWGLPFFLARNEATGEAVMAHLAWSGNWSMEFFVDTEWPPLNDVFAREGPPLNAGLFFALAPHATAPQRMIAPGEMVTSPAVHLAFLRGDLDGCVQELHAHLRRSVFAQQPAERGLLIGAGRVVAGDEDWLRREIDMAAETGCEYFVVDAGWYGAKPDSWWTTVGDWQVGHWLPTGLASIRAYVHGQGMLFGLWMEPESIGSDSLLLQERPDWALRRDGELVADGRALDLSQPEVARWVEDEIARVIAEHEVDIFKLDYNTFIHDGGQHIADEAVENTLWRHYEALYGIIDRVRARFPHIVLENCAAGGGRNDLGLAGRFHVSCQSDWTVPPRSLKALSNLTIALPPEQLRYYFGHIPGYHDYGDLEFQLRVTLFANPIFVGFAPNDAGLDAPLRQHIRRYVDLYKSFMRPILPTCRVFHHTPALALASSPPWCVLEYAAPDATRAYAGIFRLAGGGDSVYHLYPRGLDPRRTYGVTLDNSGVSSEQTGGHLMRDGLRVRLECPLTSELILFHGR